jgi:hypothetical protein
MAISADEIFNKITDAAQGAFKEGWSAVKDYAPVEFKKMAVQLESIAKNVAAFELDSTLGYSAGTGKVLFRMQRRSAEAVLVAVTQLTLIAVEKAINAIIKVIKDAFGTVLAGVL